MRFVFPATILAIIASAASVRAEAAIAIRFHPATGVWLHQVDAARRLTSAVVQNTAVVNTGDHPVTITGVRFDVLHSGRLVLSKPLGAAALDDAAAYGVAMEQAGMLQVLDFQFAPRQLLGEDVATSPTRTLAPNAALLIPSQLLVFSAPADRIEVTVELDGTEERTSGSLPVRGDAAAETFRFPLEGRWWIGAGATSHHHHRWMVPQEFALDIARVGSSGMTFSGSGERMRDYYAWNAPVLAAADGEVVAAVDRYPDNVAMLRRGSEPIEAYRKRLFAAQDALLAGGIENVSGNHVILRHEDGLHSVYAHLRRDSVKVEVGQRVRAGSALGRLGSSGNSTEPHLHFHVCDAPAPVHCAGIPVRFDNVEIPWAERERQLQSGDLVRTR